MGTPAEQLESSPAGLSRDQLLDLYYYLILTRSLEERLGKLYRQGKVIGGLYRSLGQEGESVASAYALQSGDVLSPLIRNLGSMLVRGARPVEVLRQYMAKETSPTAGREMNLHFNDLDLGYLGQISPLGDMIPVMAGICLSFKMRRQPRVGMVYIGDGGTSTGTFHEGVNLAAVQRLPLVVVVEQNGYAYSTPTALQTAVTRLADKAKAYGIPGVTVDGNDVLAVYETAKEAVDRARGGGGTTLVEVVTYRRAGHAEHDDQRYQPRTELDHWAHTNDPVDRYTAQLRDRGWATQEDLDGVVQRVRGELEEAVATCQDEPLPQERGALSAVWASPQDADLLWFRRLNG